MQELPYDIKVLKKQKKKSKSSQLMKQRRRKQAFDKLKRLNKFQKQSGQQMKLSTEDIIEINKPNVQETPEMFDKINYIALQQFQGSLQDQRTLQTYSKAIKQNSHLFINKTILHLTTGCNCFYAIFAAEAGARKVYCAVNGNGKTDRQNVWMMQQIILENQLQNIIQVLCFSQFNAQVDIIIGQPMGFVMHYDGMMDRMIEARDLYLDKKDGLMFPDKIKFKCCLIKDEHFYDKKVQFWNQVYGIPMQSMKKWISHQPIIKVVDPDLVVSGIVKFLEFDISTVSYQEMQKVNRSFQIPIYSDGQFNGLSIWFQVEFNHGTEKVELKGSPWMNRTKFTHVTLYNHPKIDVLEGKNVQVKMQGKKYANEGVSIMKINIEDSQMRYTFS